MSTTEMGRNIQPRFEVEYVDDVAKVTKCKYVRNVDAEGRPTKGGHFEYVEEEEPFGYMVYFPHQQSMRVRTKAELVRLGFHRQPGLVDMETGDVITEDREPTSLKDLVSRTENATSRRGSAATRAG